MNSKSNPERRLSQVIDDLERISEDIPDSMMSTDIDECIMILKKWI